jgi:NAD-dependent dihydropyrimidine dehydrogenase PreA subunit
MMTENHQVYRKLQQHLNRQAVGFPATKSGVELKILSHIFTPREAEIATCLTYRFASLETVFERSRHLVSSSGELEQILDDLQVKGGIESKIEDGIPYYCNAPLVVGMYEFQLNRLTPEFIRNFDQYKADINFGIEFLSTELPQMRTVPIAKSITTRHHVSTYDEITALLKQGQPPFAIFECICRKKKGLEGKTCQVTDRKETCMAVGNMAEMALKIGAGREVSLEEMLSIVAQNQKEGLVMQPSNTEKIDFLCSCCGCCCGMLRMHQSIPLPMDFWSSNYQAHIDAQLCNGCASCEKRCQVAAARITGKKPTAQIDLKRCIGCGLCVPTCPRNAIALVQKPDETKPPPTRQALYDTIMSKKKGAWGRLKLTGKLFFDAIRTGQTHLLK